MIEFFDHAWAIWVLAAILAALLEITVPSFSFSFASLGAMVAALASLHFNWQTQAVVFSFTSIASMLMLRTRLVKRFHVHNHLPSRSQALIGLEGEVTEAIDSARNAGRVQVAGQDWAARADHALTQPLPVGRKIKVSGFDGIVLIVKEI